LERFDRAQGQESDPNPIPTIEAVPATNGVNKVKKEAKVKSETPASRSISATTPPTPTDDDHDSEPPKKKIKKSNGNSKEMNDADLAAMLQAQENSRGRATRGGGVKKAKVVKKKTPKKKSAAKIKVDDDSDVELNSDGEVKEKPKKGGFHKQYQLSESLADMVGANAVSSTMMAFRVRLVLTLYSSCQDLKWSRKYGSTCAHMNYRIRATNDRSYAMKRWRECSRQIKCTCLP